MKTLWNKLPGPLPLKVLSAVVLAVVALVVLGFVFEWAGDLLDSGGVITG